MRKNKNLAKFEKKKKNDMIKHSETLPKIINKRSYYDVFVFSSLGKVEEHHNDKIKWT